MGIQLNQVRAKQRMVSSARLLEACKKMGIDPSEFLNALPDQRMSSNRKLQYLDPLNKTEKQTLRDCLLSDSWAGIGEVLGVVGSPANKYANSHHRFAKLAFRHLAYLERQGMAALNVTEEENN